MISAAAWAVGASMTYSSGGNTLAFAGYRDLVGGNSTNTFNISGTPLVNLAGGSGAETPELGSVALFGSGMLGLAGYTLVRLRRTKHER